MAVTLDADGPGRWVIRGDLDFASVPEAWRLLRPLVSRPGAVTLGLGATGRANSAALGLLLECLEQARRSGCELRVADLPDALRDLAQVSNLVGVLEPLLD